MFRPKSWENGQTMLAKQSYYVQFFGDLALKTTPGGPKIALKLFQGKIWVVWRIFEKMVKNRLFWLFWPPLRPNFTCFDPQYDEKTRFLAETGFFEVLHLLEPTQLA